MPSKDSSSLHGSIPRSNSSVNQLMINTRHNGKLKFSMIKLKKLFQLARRTEEIFASTMQYMDDRNHIVPQSVSYHEWTTLFGLFSNDTDPDGCLGFQKRTWPGTIPSTGLKRHRLAKKRNSAPKWRNGERPAAGGRVNDSKENNCTIFKEVSADDIDCNNFNRTEITRLKLQNLHVLPTEWIHFDLRKLDCAFLPNLLIGYDQNSLVDDIQFVGTYSKRLKHYDHYGPIEETISSHRSRIKQGLDTTTVSFFAKFSRR
ncbi:hypothetical protein WN51_06073 [Melipona quadrifasciata]|uniref:Uncharacterized protein n=1 Tax=Melipona quadrifasciata TaxID=166423 RepID=A0A0M8ZRQ2_9HYME|nr:hypothetical protein WN51_06073 [Melipona quadrifasciata]